MIKFSNAEFDYIHKQYDYIRDNFHENAFGATKMVDMNYLDINKLNSDKEINQMFIDDIWEDLGFWAFIERGIYDGQELKDYVNDEMYCNLFQKILDDEE